MSDLVALGDLLDGMVGDDHGFDEVEWAVNEIERLRADELESIKQLVRTVAALDEKNKRIEELELRIEATLREAIGLLTTLHPTMEMDAENPLDMAQKIERHVTGCIEELDQESIHNEGVMVALREGYTEAKDRIEELEKKNLRILTAAKESPDAEKVSGHHITDEQILSAWVLLDKCTEGCKFVMEAAFNNMGIFRCEGCGGRARGWIDNDPNAEGSYEAVCPGCNGKGWVKK